MLCNNVEFHSISQTQISLTFGRIGLKEVLVEGWKHESIVEKSFVLSDPSEAAVVIY